MTLVRWPSSTSSIGSKAFITTDACTPRSDTRRRSLLNPAPWLLEVVYVKSGQGHPIKILPRKPQIHGEPDAIPIGILIGQIRPKRIGTIPAPDYFISLIRHHPRGVDLV